MQYDPQVALQKATEVFWQAGYQGTKMRDLQAHMDMRPGSIYAGFGNKSELFTRVMEFYVASSLAALHEQLAAHNDSLSGLQAFVKTQIIGQPEGVARHCLLVKTLSELAHSEPVLCDAARRGLKQIEAGFAEAFQQALDEGKMSQSHSATERAQQLQALIMGLRSYAQLDPDPVRLAAMVDAHFAALQ